MSESLQARGLPVSHGFGKRDAGAPKSLRRPHQVHGVGVVVVREPGPEALGEADAVVCNHPQVPVGIVTADCVPILVASRDGRVVAAIHGGWRGLAAGVVASGVAALRELTEDELVAAIGPHAGPCCYEVDTPVLDALGERFSAILAAACRPSRPGHMWLDLGQVANAALEQAEVTAIERLPDACTACPGAPFFSVRRDGAETGRLLHWIQAG
ncbi:MAG: polyphenol oxidase family protein [Deltaproteobacteria bacterium]|nr:polyphenol oxidase family protein [Deltaproteobacteria bacterium]MBW2393852.1 polyphenol oxidase family protein [Deltaproteobacteria bacterium]